MVVRWSLLMLFSMVCLALFASVVVADDHPADNKEGALSADGIYEFDTDQTHKDSFSDPLLKSFIKNADASVGMSCPGKLPKDWNEESNGDMSLDEAGRKMINSLTSHFIGAIIEIVFVILSAFLFCLGVCIYNSVMCCCVKTKKEDKEKPDTPATPILRFIGNIILALIVIAIVHQAVAMLLASNQVRASIQEVPDVVHDLVKDVANYIDYHIKYLIDFVENAIIGTINDIIETMQERLTEIADSINEKDILDDIEIVEERIAYFHNLKPVKEKIDAHVEAIRNIDVTVPGNPPDPTGTIADIKKAIQNASNHFERMKNEMEVDAVTAQLGNIETLKEKVHGFGIMKKSFKTLGGLEVHNFSLFISEGVKGIEDTGEKLKNMFSPLKEKMDSLMNKYKIYVNIVGYTVLSVAISILINAAIYFVGLIFGFTAKRPNYKQDGCCVKPTADKVLSMATSSTNVSIFITALICGIFLFASAPLREFVCEPWRNPKDRTDVLELGDKVFNQVVTKVLSSDFTAPTIESVIDMCAEDKTFYQFLNFAKFEKKFFGGQTFEEAINSVANKWEADMKEDSKNFFEGDNLPRQMKQLWDKFKETANDPKLTIPMPRFDDITTLIETKKALVNSLPPQLQMLTNTLANKLDELGDHVKELKPIFMGVNAKLIKFKRLPSELTKTENLINYLNSAKFRQKLDDEGDNLVQQLQVFKDKITELRRRLHSDLTSCKPIKRMLSNFETSICGHIYDPLAGIHFGSFLMVFYGMLAVIAGLLLSKCYKRSCAEPKPEDKDKKNKKDAKKDKKDKKKDKKDKKDKSKPNDDKKAKDKSKEKSKADKKADAKSKPKKDKK